MGFKFSESERYVIHGLFSTSSSDDNDFDETVGDIYDRDADIEDGGYEKPQEPLYPGPYRALYAERIAVMELDEDQAVRVVGRGGDSRRKGASETCIGPGKLFGSC
jgi:hypothetical protein